MQQSIFKVFYTATMTEKITLIYVNIPVAHAGEKQFYHNDTMLKLFHLAQHNKEKKNCKTILFWQLINQVDCLESAGIGTGPPLTRGQILYKEK